MSSASANDDPPNLERLGRVGRGLTFRQVGGDEHHALFVGDRVRQRESGQLAPGPGRVPGFLGELASGAFERILIEGAPALRDLPGVSIQRVPVLAHQQDAVVGVERDHADGAAPEMHHAVDPRLTVRPGRPRRAAPRSTRSRRPWHASDGSTGWTRGRSRWGISGELASAQDLVFQVSAIAFTELGGRLAGGGDQRGAEDHRQPGPLDQRRADRIRLSATPTACPRSRPARRGSRSVRRPA